MNPRVREALLWGVVGLLTFLVLLQGYELLQDVRVDLAVKGGAAVVVGVASAAITYVTSGRAGMEPTTETAGETSTADGPGNGADAVDAGEPAGSNGTTKGDDEV